MFDWRLHTRIVCGAGALAQLGELTRGLGRRALLVTDPGIVQAGHAARAETFLSAAGVATAVFAAVHENPTTDDVEACLEIARQFRPEVLIALGGGSAMDTAKGTNFILTNGGPLRDFWVASPVRRGFASPLLPSIAIPTTAGTGSEVQCHALIADATTHAKMALGETGAEPTIALLDPELTLSLPRGVTANVGIDALVHAIETAVTKPRTPLSLLFSHEAFRLLSASFGLVLREPNNLEAREGMLLGSTWAGLAIEYSMLGIAHSLANPLTAHFGTVHGQAVGVMLPHVIRFNAQYPAAHRAYEALGHTPEALATLVTGWLEQAQMHTTLTECGITESLLPTLAAEAARQWTATFNPRSVTVSDLEMLYRAAL
ncbi:iron-containing alcohol dehydrogenase [Armatimonas sp.]|uniref:iron-containing alcohol dehydrogenase n=1 Tax=Armatimonas sp. TaxID=1872638 RepID=UPI00375333D4